MILLRTNDNCRDDGSKFLSLLHQRFQLVHLDDSRFGHELQPIPGLPSFLLRNAQFMDEVGPALARLRLFNIGADGGRGTQILFPENPSSTCLLYTSDAADE